MQGGSGMGNARWKKKRLSIKMVKKKLPCFQFGFGFLI
jgi:hypothetical protein